MLMLHAGAKAASEAELDLVKTPDATDTWCPVPHSALVKSVETAVLASGYQIQERQYGLMRDGARMFGAWALVNGVAREDYQLAIGIRNSHDKSFPAGVAVGSRVFVCDNLAFSSQIVISRKHTSRILGDLDRLVAQVVGRFGEARIAQDRRIEAYKGTDVSDTQVHDFLVRSADAKVIAYQTLPKVLDEYRKPRHEEFAPRTAWSLFNSYTEILKGTMPFDLVSRTTRLHGLMDLLAGLGGPEAAIEDADFEVIRN